MKPDRLLISDVVASALARHQPVVALETTLITHGLPPEEGLRTALKLEATVCNAGATPATIGVLDGAVLVGMSEQQLERLATSNATKLNPGNLAAQLVSNAAGSTTVAATAFIAHRVGIKTFATGGIGGVHRGVNESFDISADLTALSRHPVAVVCAGAKAILDLPRTVEMLETLGVPVLGWRTDEFPAFYRRTSGLPVDRRFDELQELANAIHTHWALGATSGVLIANPIPEEHEASDQTDEVLEAAIAEAVKAGVTGRDVTPFLLERMRRLTGGASVTANKALLDSNTRVAAALAVALES
jgi:pseudouridine-5'-phosphate glycosidase